MRATGQRPRPNAAKTSTSDRAGRARLGRGCQGTRRAAYDPSKRDDTVTPVAGDLVSGKVRNLRKDFLVGTIGGPAFEADLETERGAGTVRFMLTRQGLELMSDKPPPQMLN